VRLVPGHFANKQKRSVTQLHLPAGFDRKGGHLFGHNLWHELSYAVGDLDSVLIQLCLPKETGEH
jgi:hypothetical protein